MHKGFKMRKKKKGERLCQGPEEELYEKIAQE